MIDHQVGAVLDQLRDKLSKHVGDDFFGEVTVSVSFRAGSPEMGTLQVVETCKPPKPTAKPPRR